MIEKILAPINELNPCGIDSKYEDSFLSLESEIDKSNSMIQDISTDWTKVYNKSFNLLTTSTKDIKVFCWLIYAVWKKEGSSGLEKELKLFNTVLVTYKDDLFPKSQKIRISSLLWLEELLNEEMLDERGGIDIALNAESLFTIFKELEINFAIVVKEEVSIFKKLRLALEQKMKSNEPKEILNSDTSSNTKKVTENISTINSDDDALQMLQVVKKNITSLHNYYRSENSSDIRPIRLVRLLAWLEIDSLPINEDGKTHINPPSQMSTNNIDELIEEEKFDEALDSLESLISRSPFWLDGHFIAFNLLMNMGHTACALEVKNILVSFVKADNNILKLSFKDTTPFASIKLKKWLSESMEYVVKDNNTDTENVEDEKKQVVEKAFILAKKKQIKEAMELLQGCHISAVNMEEKFYWCLVKAELAVEFGKSSVALALIEELKKDIEKYNLDEWKPELSSKVYYIYLTNFNRTQVDIEDINIVYARLCKIDIKKALEIKI